MMWRFDANTAVNTTQYQLYGMSGVLGGGGGGPALEIAGNSVSENVAIGAAAGSLSVANTNATFKFELVAGDGDDGNGSFNLDTPEINSSNILTAAVFDRETQSSYDIRVLATETSGGGLLLTNTFTISVGDVSEPVDRMFANAEVKSTTTLAATLEAMAGGVTYGITAGEHHAALFEIQNTDELHLKTAATAGQVGDEYFVEVTASGGVTDSMLIKVTVVSGTPKGTVFIFR